MALYLTNKIAGLPLSPAPPEQACVRYVKGVVYVNVAATRFQRTFSPAGCAECMELLDQAEGIVGEGKNQRQPCRNAFTLRIGVFDCSTRDCLRERFEESVTLVLKVLIRGFFEQRSMLQVLSGMGLPQGGKSFAYFMRELLTAACM
jgi:hypothetical protein